MAEPVYKSITELDQFSGSLDGSETMVMVKAGKTYRRMLQNLFGSGWISALLAAFSSFVAPRALLADDADLVGGEDNAALHNASLLTGNIDLARIPAELTGKNAATSTVAASVDVAQVADNVAYPLALLASAGAGAKAIKSDTSGGTYNPSNNTLAANISGNAATATSATTATTAGTASNALACSGNAATVTRGVYRYTPSEAVPFNGLYLSAPISPGVVSTVLVSAGAAVPTGSIYILLATT
jgi:hypothetical protein